MSTKARKARKRAGEKHRKVGVAKVGTPVEKRQVPLVWKRDAAGKFGWSQSGRALSAQAHRQAVAAAKPGTWVRKAGRS